MEIDFRSLLLADPDLAALVGVRVDWLLRPQSDPTPSIVLTIVSAPISYTINAPSVLQRSVVQVDVYGTTYLEMHDAREALIALISAFSGTVGSTHFDSIFVTAHRQTKENGKIAETTFFRDSLDLTIQHKGV